MLDRRLPIVCLLRFLSEAEVCPNLLSVPALFEMIAKYLPPSNNNHREVIFYSAETAANYAKEYMNSNLIKLVEGDIGLSFYEFQLVMLRIAFELSKENHQKADCCQMIRKLLQDLIGLRASTEVSLFDSKRKTKFMIRLQNFSKVEHDKKAKQTKKKIPAPPEEDMGILDEDEIPPMKDQAGNPTALTNIKICFDL